MLLGQYRCASSDAADDGQAGFGRCGLEVGNTYPREAPGVISMAPLRALEVLLRGIGRLEAELLSDLRAGWRITVVFRAALDEGEDFRLARRQRSCRSLFFIQ